MYVITRNIFFINNNIILKKNINYNKNFIKLYTLI